MRLILVWIGLMLPLNGCFNLMSQLSATKYHSVAGFAGMTESRGSNADIEVSIHNRGLGKNQRMNEKLRANRSAIKWMTVTNKSGHPMKIRPEDIRFAIGEDIYSPIDLERIYRIAELRTWTYLYWSALFGYTFNCKNDDCSFIILPIGMAYGIGNAFYSKSGNAAMRKELEGSSWKSEPIPPHGKAEGAVFFQYGEQRYANADFQSSYYEIKYSIGDSAALVETNALNP
jgi:hypothetical protein